MFVASKVSTKSNIIRYLVARIEEPNIYKR